MTQEIAPVIDQLGKRIEAALDMYRELYQLSNDRHDSHGVQMRDGIAGLNKKIDEIHRDVSRYLTDVDKRVVVLEEKRKTGAEIFSHMLGVIGGATGLYALIDKIKGH